MSLTDWLMLILMLGIMLVALGSLQSVFGDNYDTLKVRHADVPNFCLFEVDPKLTDQWSAIKETTISAIKEWETKMNTQFGTNDWDVVIHDSYPFAIHEKQTPEDYLHCSVFITYEDTTDYDPDGDGKTALGTTAIDFKQSWHKYFFITVYLNHTANNKIHIDLGEVKPDENGSFTVSIEQVKKMIPMNSIRNILIHEIGHGFGLGHYNITLDGNKHGDISRYSAMVPSLDPWDEDHILEEQLADKIMLTKLYGTDGWLGKGTYPIPHVCAFHSGILTSDRGCD